jgi:DNA repair ATPase RecN
MNSKRRQHALARMIGGASIAALASAASVFAQGVLN